MNLGLQIKRLHITQRMRFFVPRRGALRLGLNFATALLRVRLRLRFGPDFLAFERPDLRF